MILSSLSLPQHFNHHCRHCRKMHPEFIPSSRIIVQPRRIQAANHRRRDNDDDDDDGGGDGGGGGPQELLFVCIQA